MKTDKNMIDYQGFRIFLPMPIMVVVEDVGWWQGVDGSLRNEPFRNNLNRRHCLADYKAIARFAEKLSTRIVLGMVLCEWDRGDILKKIPGATWMGTSWKNKENQGPWLDEASDFINCHSHLFEPALHGVGHEFWKNGIMERSEFHDNNCRMRDADIIAQHLNGFFSLMEQNHFTELPKIHIPPALKHSFGNQTIQPLLKQFGIDFVITRFSKARQYKAPAHPHLTWESDVVLLDRGEALVSWKKVAAQPEWKNPQPILPFHWANLLHENPEYNIQVVDQWIRLLSKKIQGPNIMMAKNVTDCFRQAGAFFLGRLAMENDGVTIDRSRLPDIPTMYGEFSIKIKGNPPVKWQCRGADIVSVRQETDQIQRLRLRPESRVKKITLLRSAPHHCV